MPETRMIRLSGSAPSTGSSSPAKQNFLVIGADLPQDNYHSRDHFEPRNLSLLSWLFRSITARHKQLMSTGGWILLSSTPCYSMPLCPRTANHAGVQHLQQHL